MKQTTNFQTTQTPVMNATRMSQLTIGIDLGDQWSQFCLLDADGVLLEERDVSGAHARPFRPASAHSPPLASPWRPAPIRSGPASCWLNWAMRSSWRLCARCGLLPAVTVKVTGPMPASWPARHAWTRRSCIPCGSVIATNNAIWYWFGRGRL